ncbi:MAG: choice-of-anchor D domain-containing protein, partial [bacterium]|nr:choice-of-anchor D domain-containing protein [Candidatus Kapabacteria bacterium]
AFFRTTAENFTGVDTNVSIPATMTLGLLSFDFVGRSVGSKLASNAAGIALRPMSFPAVRIRDTLTRSIQIANSGACDLRISKANLRLFSGDVNEFKIMSALSNATVDAATDDYVMAPGQVDSIVIRFIPSRSGTRMVTVRLRTNDSTILIPGVGERGAYLLDVQGQGKAGLDPRDLVLSPVLIGSSSNGIAVLENSSTAVVEVSNIFFASGNAAEFLEDNIAAWPSRPAQVLPGAKLRLGVKLTPVGLAGDRRTQLHVVTTSNDTFRVNIRGEAGTQQLAVTPNNLFDDVSIPVGLTARRTVMISNNGTLPIRLDAPVLSGPDMASYRIGTLPRLDLPPGGTEYLEVTFAPTTQGPTTAQISISALGGTPQIVMLGGTALRARKDGNPTTTAMTGGDLVEVAGGTPNGVSGVSGSVEIAGVMLSAPTPNPATATAAINFAIPTSGDVSIKLFDASGRIVRELTRGDRDAGNHRLTVDISDLPSGVLYYRMTFGGMTVTQSLIVSH